jgi:putative peptidoglycan lipid II flippase
MITSSKSLSVESWISASALLVGVTGISKVLGFVRELLLAAYLGASGPVDAYAVAYAIPLFLAGGIGYAFSTSLIPGYHHEVARNGNEAGSRYLVTTCASAVVWSLIVLTPVWLFPNLLVKVSAPWLPEATARLTVELMGWLAFYVLIQNLVYVLSAVFHALSHFRFPAISELFFNIIVIGVFVSAVSKWNIRALVAGNLAGIAACMLLLTIGLVKVRGELHGVDFKSKWLLRPLVACLPVGTYYLASQAPGILANYFASGLGEGNIAAFTYAKVVLMGIVSLITMNIARGVFPTLAKLAAGKRSDDLRQLVTGLAKMICFIFVPVSLGAFLYREPILRLLYQRGAFDEAALQLTATVFGFLALGLVFAAWEPIGIRAFYAAGEMRFPLIATLASIVALLLLLSSLAHAMGLAGVGIAFSIALACDCVVQLYGLHVKVGFVGGPHLELFFAKCVACAMFAGLTLVFLPRSNAIPILFAIIAYTFAYSILINILVQPIRSITSVASFVKL